MMRTQRALAAARIVVGALIVIRTTPLIGLLHHPLIDVPRIMVGWPSEGWTIPLGPGLPEGLIEVLCVARTLLALAFAIGLAPRWSGLGAGVTGLLVASNDVFASSHTFRLLYGSAIVLATCDCGAAWSVRRTDGRDLDASVLAVRLWLVSIYAWAAVAKASTGWISGAVLGLDAADGMLRPWAAHALTSPDVRIALANVVLAGELSIAALLAIPRATRLGVALALLTQIAFELVAQPDVFGVVIVTLLMVLAVTDRTSDRPAHGAGRTFSKQTRSSAQVASESGAVSTPDSSHTTRVVSRGSPSWTGMSTTPGTGPRSSPLGRCAMPCPR